MVLIQHSSVDEVLSELKRTRADVMLSLQLLAEMEFASKRREIEEDRTNGTLKRASKLEAAHSQEARYAQKMAEEIFGEIMRFLSAYGINYPGLSQEPDYAKASIERVLEESGQPALEALKGVVKLAGKVVYFTRDANQDPRPYVKGLLSTLEGVPVWQLCAVSGRQSVVLGEWTIRDKVSELITLGNAGKPLYMLQLLGGKLPDLATAIRQSRKEAYARFLDEALSALLGNYLSSSSGQPPPEEIEGGLLKISERLGVHGKDEATDGLERGLMPSNDERHLTPKQLEEVVLSGKFGGPVQAVIATSRHDGGNQVFGFYVGEPERTTKVFAVYGSLKLSHPVADRLYHLQQKCPAAIDVHHPLREANARAAGVLRHRISA